MLGLQLYSVNLTVKMQQLLSDPETIAFKKGKNINLGLLKKEIDRRITKIRGMLGDHQIPRHKPISKTNNSCQTQDIILKTAGQSYQNIKNVCTPHKNLTHMVPLKDDNNRSQKRSSLQVNKSKLKKQISYDALISQDKTKLSEYLQKAKVRDDLPFKETPQDERSEEYSKEVQNILDDKMFVCQDFDCFIEHYGKTRKISLNFEDSEEEENKESLSDSYNSLICRKRLSNLAMKARSHQKNKLTDRTAAEAESRVKVSEECRIRMLDVVASLAAQRRREEKDNKVRENILRKVDERYGGYYDNL